MTQRMDGLTDMGQAKAGVSLKARHTFGFGCLEFEMPVRTSGGHMKMELNKKSQGPGNMHL